MNAWEAHRDTEVPARSSLGGEGAREEARHWKSGKVKEIAIDGPMDLVLSKTWTTTMI